MRNPKKDAGFYASRTPPAMPIPVVSGNPASVFRRLQGFPRKTVFLPNFGYGELLSQPRILRAMTLSETRNIPENTAVPRRFRGRPLRDGGPSFVSLLRKDDPQFQDRLATPARRHGGAEGVQRGRRFPAGVELVAHGETKQGLGAITEGSDAANVSDGPAVASGQLGIVEIDFHEAAN